jgi:hypothetical protein
MATVRLFSRSLLLLLGLQQLAQDLHQQDEARFLALM